MVELPKDRIDAIPVKPEHLVSDAMKTPPEPQVFTASINMVAPKPRINNG